jgi:hypothetical protein
MIVSPSIAAAKTAAVWREDDNFSRERKRCLAYDQRVTGQVPVFETG